MSQVWIGIAVIALVAIMMLLIRARRSLLCAVEHIQDEHKQVRIQLDRQQQLHNAPTQPTPAESVQMTKNLAYATQCYNQSVLAYQGLVQRYWPTLAGKLFKSATHSDAQIRKTDTDAT